MTAAKLLYSTVVGRSYKTAGAAILAASKHLKVVTNEKGEAVGEVVTIIC